MLSSTEEGWVGLVLLR
uniref:Uncharacterized protein n=1 Tax=Rhizophora mucronata TaxID=61149 RepID=A0A2P2R3E3_RHIMU